MPLALCPFCQKEVLGLVGQDITLDTFYLQDSAEDRIAIETGMFGICHFLCLTTSHWGSFWSKRIIENMATARKFPILAVIENITFLRNENLQETIAIRQDGWLAFIDDKNLKARSDIDGGYLVPTHHELNLDLSDHPILAAMMQGIFMQGRTCSILNIVEELNLADRLLYPQALKDGVFVEFTGAARGKKSQVYKTTQPVISTEAKYSYFLPEVMQKIIEQI